MRNETRSLLCGMIAGLALGILVSFVVHRRQSMRPVTTAETTDRRPAMFKDDGATTARPQAQAGTNTVIPQSDESIAIQIIPGSSLTFSVPFVKVMRELKAAGESPDVIVNV